MERRKRSEVGVGTRVPNVDREPQDVLARDDEAARSPLVQPTGSIGRIPRGEPGTRVNVHPDEAAEQRAGEVAFANAAGDEVVEVTWGEELFQPVQYNSFRVGPFKASTIVRKGETVAKAMLRLHVEMMGAAHKIHDAEAEKYVEDLAALIRKTNGVKL